MGLGEDVGGSAPLLPRSGQWYLAWLFHLRESQTNYQYPAALSVVFPLVALGRKTKKSILFSSDITVRKFKCSSVITVEIIIYGYSLNKVVNISLKVW